MKFSVRISSIILSVLVIGIVGTILYSTRAPKASVQEVPVLITNETESLQVVSSKMEGNKLVLVIKNIDDQPIIAYHFDWKAKEGMSGDLTNTGGLAPGSQFTAVIPLSQLELDAITGLYKFNIAMAFFEDGNAEGSWTRAQIYRDRIEGAALAAPQILEKVSHVSSLSVPTIERFANDLKTITPPPKLSKWQKIGYEEAIIRVRGQAEYLLRQQQSPDKIEKRIVDLRKSIERQTILGRNIVEGRQSQ